MLRVLALLLVAANVVFWGFTRGWFDGAFGLHADGDREPERLTRQVRPQAIRIVAAAASQPAPGTPCLELGPVSAADAAAVQAGLSTLLPAGSWSEQRHEAASGGGTVVTHSFRMIGTDPALAARASGLAFGPGGRYAFTDCARPGR